MIRKLALWVFDRLPSDVQFAIAARAAHVVGMRLAYPTNAETIFQEQAVRRVRT